MDKCQPLRSATIRLQRVIGVEDFIFGHVSTSEIGHKEIAEDFRCRKFDLLPSVLPLSFSYSVSSLSLSSSLSSLSYHL